VTKGELRKMRKTAQREGKPLVGVLAIESHQDSSHDTMVFSESTRGYRARERWARHYDDLNGAPESSEDC
jgi:hypothetical protein